VPFFPPAASCALGPEKRRNYCKAQKLVDVKGDRYGPADYVMNAYLTLMNCTSGSSRFPMPSGTSFDHRAALEPTAVRMEKEDGPIHFPQRKELRCDLRW
jgi:hypothetical protein